MVGMTDNRFSGAWNGDALAVVVCSALSLYNAVELVLLILTSFHAYRGLYFYSLTLASLGLVPYTFGFLIEYFKWNHLSIGIAFDTIGWILTVTGQAVVLYSRLWIVFGGGHKRLLRGVKWMIITNAFVLHGTTAVLVYGSHFSKHGHPRHRFGTAYDYFERIQMCIFCTQEFIISGLYIWRALDILKTSDRACARRLMWQLFSINIIIIVLDVYLLAVEFSGKHVLQQTSKGVTYSIKLKLELSILNKLIELSQSNRRVSATTFGIPTNDFLDPTKTVWDITRFTPGFTTSAHATHPKWMVDLENSGIQQVNHTYSPTEKTFLRAKHSRTVAPNERFSDEIRPVSTMPDPRLNWRERGSDTDLLYADVMRKVSTVG